MFKTQIFLFSVVLLFAAAVTLFPFFHLDENDQHLFTKLLASSKPNSHGPSTSYAEQVRHKVCKQLWFQEKGEALLCSLFSEKSALFFFYEDNKIEAIEEMTDTKCVIQEELFYLLSDGQEAVKAAEGRLRLRHADPLLTDSWVDSDMPGLTPMQYVLYLEAEKAHYHYSSQLLVAEGVRFKKYRLEGHASPEAEPEIAPQISGSASSMECTLRKEQLDFHAKNLKATFDPQEKL